MQNYEGWGIKGQVEGGLRKKVHKKEGWSIKGQIAKKKCKINRIGTLTGRWRVDCEKKC